MTGRFGFVALLSALFVSSALAAPGEAERRAITAHDQAWAKRINLALRDLPAGYRQGPVKSNTRPGGMTCRGFAPDLSRFTITGQAVSRQFASATGTAISSSAEIFRSAADQHGDWTLTARKEALPCLRQALESFSGGVLRVTKAWLRPSPKLGEHAISFRASVAVDANGVKATIWLDVLAVAQGRGDATLSVISLRKAPSAALERSLLAKLAARLRGLVLEEHADALAPVDPADRLREERRH